MTHSSVLPPCPISSNSHPSSSGGSNWCRLKHIPHHYNTITRHPLFHPEISILIKDSRNLSLHSSLMLFTLDSSSLGHTLGENSTCVYLNVGSLTQTTGDSWPSLSVSIAFSNKGSLKWLIYFFLKGLYNLVKLFVTKQKVLHQMCSRQSWQINHFHDQVNQPLSFKLVTVSRRTSSMGWKCSPRSSNLWDDRVNDGTLGAVSSASL